MDKKIDFLYAAISDAQELIRFVDTKTSYVVTVLAAYIVAFFATIEKIIDYHSYYSSGFWWFFIAFLFFLSCSLAVTTRIIRPTNNPKDNINLGGATEPSLKFFLSPNDYSKGSFYPFLNSSAFKIQDNFEKYIRQLSDANDEDLISVLSFELFKLSFIRNIKNDRYNTLLWLLVFTTFSFFTAYLFFEIETHQISDCLKKLPACCCVRG